MHRQNSKNQLNHSHCHSRRPEHHHKEHNDQQLRIELGKLRKLNDEVVAVLISTLDTISHNLNSTKMKLTFQ